MLPGKRVVMGGDPKGSGRPLSLPCGKCIGCKMERSRMWSVRIVHEASLFDSNWFVTLDYAPEHLTSWSLEYEHFQLFMKRLRKKWRGENVCPNGENAVRFFVAGEYGGQFQRPHWHVILFNLVIPDKVEWRNGTFRSEELEKLWGKGNAVIGSVTVRSAAYVAGYTLFKGGHSERDVEVVDGETGEIVERRQELVVMSRNPGIGSWWFDKYNADVFPLDKAVMSEGRVNKVPRFYWERLKLKDPMMADAVKEERLLRAQEDVLEHGGITQRQRDDREEYYRRKMSTFSKREH